MFDVVVAGGGVIGLAVAWRATQRGLRVAVADETPGQGASHAAAGMLAPVAEVHFGEESLLSLTLDSAARYPAFAAELEAASGRSIGYRTTGTVLVARDGDDLAMLQRIGDFQQRLGLDARRLRAAECRALEPALAPSIRGGILAASDHQVDNRLLVAALLEACRRAGVAFFAERVREVLAGKRVRAVRLSSGEELSTSQVVIAAGWAAKDIVGIPPLPLRPVKGQLLHLRGPADSPLLTHVVRGLDVYLAPREDGRVIVGATSEERGLDARVTAGAVRELLRAAWELVPGIDELALHETVVGFRPGTPDNAPLIGRLGPEGLVVAAGHYRNGILLTPVTAAAVADLLAEGALPAEMESFSPGRFGGVPV